MRVSRTRTRTGTSSSTSKTWASFAIPTSSTHGSVPALAPFDLGLARADAGSCLVLSDECPVTSRDIITLWVGRMVILGQYNMGDVPFHDVYITPDQGRSGETHVEVEGQRRGPARHHRVLRDRRAPLHDGAAATETQDYECRSKGGEAQLPDGKKSTRPSASSRDATSPTSSGTSPGSP